jgi:hypothetical protein
MSILKSTNTGRKKIIREYFDNFEKRNNVVCDIKTGKNKKGKEYLYAEVLNYITGKLIVVDGKTLPCPILFSNEPYINFVGFIKKEHYDNININNFKELYKFVFNYCVFSEDMWEFYFRFRSNIRNSKIFLPNNFFEYLEKRDISICEFLVDNINYGNDLYMRESGNNLELEQYSHISDEFIAKKLVEDGKDFMLIGIDKMKELIETARKYQKNISTMSL